MANLTPATETYYVTVWYGAIDDYGMYRERSKIFEVNTGVGLFLDAAAGAAALVADIALTSKADILGYAVTEVRKAASSAVTAVANLRAEGLLSLNPADGSEKMPHTIIAPVNAIVAGNSLINDSALLLDYIANFQGTENMTMSDGEQVAATNPIAASSFKITGAKYK